MTTNIEKNDFALIDADVTHDKIELWQRLSAETLSRSLNNDHTGVNDALETLANNRSYGPFRQLYWYWIGSNLRYAGAEMGARECFKTAIKCGKNDGTICNHNTIEASVRESLASIYLESNDIDLGIEQYDALIQLHDSNHKRPAYIAGLAMESVANKNQAIHYYDLVADSQQTTGPIDYAQLARRNIDRLNEERHNFTLDELTRAICDALLTRDGATLRSLASSTHFSFINTFLCWTRLPCALCRSGTCA